MTTEVETQKRAETSLQTTVARRRRKPRRHPIVDLRCVQQTGHPELLTIDEALGVLSGHGVEEPASQRFLRTGQSASPHASYRVLGTPDDVAKRLAEYRKWSDAMHAFALGRRIS